MKTSFTQFVIERIKYPIAICDGTFIKQLENTIISIFQSDGIPFTLEEWLYTRKDYDLSQYKTIVFGTSSAGSEIDSQLQKIFSFDKKNLELVMALNKNAFFKIKDLVKELHIDCLGFYYEGCSFFDPFTEFPGGQYW